MTPHRILSQGRLGACTGYALAGACESLLRQDISPEWGWSLGRIKQGTYPQDVGVSLKTVVDEVKYRGMALDKDHDLDVDPRSIKITTLPFDYREIKSGIWLKPDVDAICRSLDAGRPVVIAITITEAWQALEGPWASQQYRGRLASSYELAAGHGQHAMWVYGHEKGAFKVVNSFGPAFGDNGIGRLPFDVAANDIFQAYEVMRIGDKFMDAERLKAISDYVNQHLQPILDAAEQYNVEPAEIDAAMNWPNNTWNTLRR